MKKKIISFYSPNLKLSAQRFRDQADSICVFDEVTIYNGSDLQNTLYDLYGNEFDPRSRGWGYWCWEPYILQLELNNLNDGDILFYSDIGCHINSLGRNVLEKTYVPHIKEHGALLFQSDQVHSEQYAFWPEWQWSKPDLIYEIFTTFDEQVLNTGQIVSTVYGLEVNSLSRKIVAELFDLYKYNFDLMNDTPSVIKPPDDFRENRHIQSGLSLLVKKYKLETRSLLEIEHPSLEDYKTKDWQELKMFPFNAKRDLQFDLATKINRFKVGLLKKLSL